MICRICGNSESNKEFQVREMVFGLRDEFTYFECSKCGCLQIAEIPADMKKYYPSDYYSFEKKEATPFKKFLLRKRNEYALFKRGFIGQVIYRKYPDLVLDELSIINSMTNINYDSRILDVGCGAGNLLHSLSELGFKHLMGVDPYIDEEVINRGVTILKKTIHQLPSDQKFELIILGSSLEHMPDQLETLSKVSQILSEEGICLIRMPVKTDYIFNRYGSDWVLINAPRHFFVHTLNSFQLCMEKSALIIQDVIFDSDESTFWRSEQIRRNIPIRAANSYSVNPKKSIFTAKQIREFRKMAKELNVNKQGDRAAFYIRKR